ncbi:nitroreductase family protein [Streptomyces sp. NPDC046727]|uniref:nitroreductase family protein n=1 Tax=Streptomyces sp. NPDC046727 TaxID=3155373 RepID=UPI0033C14EA9
MAPAVNETISIHPVIADRWSPRAYDTDHVLSDSALDTILEAGRWAPSSRNSQPWRFVVGRRGDSVFKQIFDCLAPVNREWAGSASALIGGVVQLATPEGAPLNWGLYDVGQAFSHMTFQAHGDGLHARQMAGFDQDALRRTFAIPEDYRPCVVMAVGRLGTPDGLPERLRAEEGGPRLRHDLNSLTLREGSAGTPW